jgi:hypothetical protein
MPAFIEYAASPFPTSTYQIPFPRLSNSHVKLYRASESNNFQFSLVSGTSYSININTLTLTESSPLGSILRIRRETPSTSLVDLQNASRLGEQDLETDSKQALYLIEEAEDSFIIDNNSVNPLRGQCSRTTPITGSMFMESVGQYMPILGVHGWTFDSTISNLTNFKNVSNQAMLIGNTSNSLKIVKVYASLDAKSANNQTLGVKLIKSYFNLNHEEIHESECRAFTGSGNQEAKLVTSWILRLPPFNSVDVLGFYGVGLAVANFSGTTGVVPQRGKLIVTEV